VGARPADCSAHRCFWKWEKVSWRCSRGLVLRGPLLHNALLRMREEGGGDVPALASSLHMLDGVVCGLFGHPRRGDHSVPGPSLRLPTEVGAISPLSCRRCTWNRQFRDAVDTVPSQAAQMLKVWVVRSSLTIEREGKAPPTIRTILVNLANSI
jgi:hypothetical protein